MSSPSKESPDGKDSNKLKVRTHTPRPDELTRETFEFITAVDDYKRRNMRSFLNDSEVLEILFDLGYRLPGRSDLGREPAEEQLKAYAAARQRYRVEQGRLFPAWSEVFELLHGLGYQRGEERDAA